MARYSAIVSERYDDETPTHLHRICGAPIGLATADWPRWRGRPMQHAFTIDLAGLELEIPRAAEARALAVFVDSYYELDVESSEGITLVWLTQAQIDAHGQTTPPDDFEPELRPNREQMDEEGGYYETGEPGLELEPDEDDGEFGDSWIGGRPNWGEQGEPERVPAGAFVMQVMSHSFPICRLNACLFVFEGGAYLRPEYADDRRPLPWSEAIARSRELVVLDQPPAADSLQKWGGLPRGIDSYSWPRGLSHILTWVPEEPPEDADVIAYALFGRLSKRDNWDDELTFYQVNEIRAAELDEWDAEQVEAPEGVELLEERAIELRELPEGTTWRDLQTRSFVGPRPARSPERPRILRGLGAAADRGAVARQPRCWEPARAHRRLPDLAPGLWRRAGDPRALRAQRYALRRGHHRCDRRRLALRVSRILRHCGSHRGARADLARGARHSRPAIAPVRARRHHHRSQR
jgi:hypothetical protein